jgi:predicted RNase H-like HicB family nuclease
LHFEEGKTVELALENLGEAIELYLEDEDANVPEVDYRHARDFHAVLR